MTDEKISYLPSIQGEQQDGRAWTPRMDDTDVDTYVDNVDDNVLACRQRAHDFPPMRRNVMDFTGVDDETGLWLRYTVCRSCKLVGQTEKYLVTQTRGRIKGRVELVAKTLDYSRRGPNGERYLAKPGHGRMTRRQVRESVATATVKGTGMNYAALLKMLKDAEKDAAIDQIIASGAVADAG